MAQRVLIELLLFLIPFAVFLVYRAASRDMKIKDRWPLTRLVLIGAGIAIAALIITLILARFASDTCALHPRKRTTGDAYQFRIHLLG